MNTRQKVPGGEVYVNTVNSATLVSVTNDVKQAEVLSIGTAGNAGVTGNTATVTPAKKAGYKITAIGSNALKGSKARTIKTGKSVKQLGARAFSGCRKLKVLKVYSTGKVTVNKKAFRGLSKSQKKKVKVKVSPKMSAANFKKLKKQLTRAGIKAKNIIRMKK